MDKVISNHGMGWLPDYPDFRDYTTDYDQVALKHQLLGQKDSVKVLLKRIGVLKKTVRLEPAIDLRSWCSPIEDQLSLGSCTAHAGVGLVEYFEKRAFGRHLDASRLFLYKVTRNLLNWTGDTGAFLRTTIAAMVLFGVPPEKYWQYLIADFDNEPTGFLYAFAQNYQTIRYYRYDPPGTTKEVLLDQIKTNLAAGLPSMFGFTVYSSINQADSSGKIPYPTTGEQSLGGHAVDAVGYDDNLKIKNTDTNGTETKGALLIRNSWGTGWGDQGYGWLPYEYVLKGLAIDWWSVIKQEWIDTGVFGL
jgi:C1A family cysteine protease